MFSLDDPIWADLWHSYGSGEDIPPKLRRIATAKKLSKAFWDDLGNTLCHQCTIGTASIAAFPHLVRLAAQNVENQIGFDSLKLAAEILSYTIGPENKMPKMDKSLREPFRQTIVEGKTVVKSMLFQKKRSYRQTIDLLFIIAAFDFHVEAALLLDAFRGQGIDCPECGEWVEADRLYTI